MKFNGHHGIILMGIWLAVFVVILSLVQLFSFATGWDLGRGVVVPERGGAPFQQIFLSWLKG